MKEICISSSHSHTLNKTVAGVRCVYFASFNEDWMNGIVLESSLNDRPHRILLAVFSLSLDTDLEHTFEHPK